MFNDFQLTIKLDKAVYNVGETIEIEVSFTNIGDKALRLGLREDPAPYWLLNIYDEGKEECRKTVLIYYKLRRCGRECFLLIKPKEDYKLILAGKIEIASSSFSKKFYQRCLKKGYFNKGDLILNTKDHAFVLGRTGSFYITAKYDSRSWVKLARELEIENVFVGTLITTPITIKIR
jgi:hypothetical protein